MLLTLLLIVIGFLVAFLATSEKIIQVLPKTEPFLNFLGSLRIPLGLTGIVIGFVNAFNFWWTDYPLLTWLLVFIVSITITNEFIQDKFNIGDGFLKDLFIFFAKYMSLLGITTIIVLIIKSIYLLKPLFKAFL